MKRDEGFFNPNGVNFAELVMWGDEGRWFSLILSWRANKAPMREGQSARAVREPNARAGAASSDCAAGGRVQFPPALCS
jgi:hypothetical protein